MFFQVGDMYFAFGQEAEIAAKELGTHLIKSKENPDTQWVQIHEGYIVEDLHRLAKEGYSVASFKHRTRVDGERMACREAAVVLQAGDRYLWPRKVTYDFIAEVCMTCQLPVGTDPETADVGMLKRELMRVVSESEPTFKFLQVFDDDGTYHDDWKTVPEETADGP